MEARVQAPYHLIVQFNGQAGGTSGRGREAEQLSTGPSHSNTSFLLIMMSNEKKAINYYSTYSIPDYIGGEVGLLFECELTST